MRKLALAFALAAACVAAGCAPKDGAAPAASGTSIAAAPDSLSPPVLPLSVAGVLARAKAPGATATVVNVWASWCGPCREEFPALLATVKRHPGVRLVLVSADFDTELAPARAFLRENGVTDTTFVKQDLDQAFIDGLEPKWTGALPATLVFDAEGRQVAFWEGGADSARFETAVRQAMQGHSNGGKY